MQSGSLQIRVQHVEPVGHAKPRDPPGEGIPGLGIVGPGIVGIEKVPVPPGNGSIGNEVGDPAP
ncbi:hypothetical protein [Bacillus sp. 37MA]|uniref:hypothetical protein n=1 Tax=Bacillus sp. 37MA TaxID=1132442 RepID=UPI00037DEE32|nr:hypothetical protein [Bacillus sp. 37MA]